MKSKEWNHTILQDYSLHIKRTKVSKESNRDLPLAHLSVYVTTAIVLFLFLFYFPISVFADTHNKTNPSAITVPDGYKIETYATNLSVPTTAIFDGNDMIVAESGFLNTAKPRIIRIKPDGSQQTVVSEGLQSPVTGLLLVNKTLYISHRDKVSIVENGMLKDIVTGLPSDGDHQNNKIVLGPYGRIYMGQGTTTNGGVVGVDNYVFGWLDKHPQLHEIPCKDITLTGKNFQSDSPIKNPSGQVTTGAYHTYGEPSTIGEVIKGNAKCGGSIVSFKPDGSDFQLVSWGLRNPFGVQFDKTGQLWTTFHGADVRGSRNIFNDPDYLIQVQKDAWYGWPEFFDGKPATDMKEPTKEDPGMLWKDHPPLAQPFLTFPSHSAANGLAFSPGGSFGFDGQAFVAEYGTYSIVTSGINPAIPGFKVVKVDVQNKQIADFASNKIPGPSYINQSGGFNRPSDIVFGPDNSMYVIDWGASTIDSQGLKYVPGTGTVWRIYSNKQKSLRPKDPIIVNADAVFIPQKNRDVEVRNAPVTYKMLASQTVVLVGGFLIVIVLIILIVRLRYKKRQILTDPLPRRG